MRFGRIGPTRPEQFPKTFTVYSQGTETSPRGRERLATPVEKTTLRGILSIARPEEIERFRQREVEITHTILQRGAPVAKENDVLALVKGGMETRYFRIKAIPHDKGEMDIDTAYYCEERNDRHGI